MAYPEQKPSPGKSCFPFLTLSAGQYLLRRSGAWYVLRRKGEEKSLLQAGVLPPIGRSRSKPPWYSILLACGFTVFPCAHWPRGAWQADMEVSRERAQHGRGLLVSPFCSLSDSLSS